MATKHSKTSQQSANTGTKANSGDTGDRKALNLIDEIDENIEKAKAIADLMAAAALDQTMDHDQEIRWGEIVVRELLDKIAESSNALGEMARTNEATA